MSEEDLQPLDPEEGIERFLRHRKPSIRESSYRNAKTRLGFFEEWCEEREIDNLNDLTGRLLADFVAWRQDDVKAVTLQKQLSTIRVALRYWADIEAVPDGLAEKVHAPELSDGEASRDVHLSADRAETILAHLNRYDYASRDHALMVLAWKTGMRRGAIRSLDVDDMRPDDHALVLEHRPDTGTKLKNGSDGERWIYLGPEWYGIIEEYVEANRLDKTDEYGRRPLLATQNGRPMGDTIYKWINRLTQPCHYGECPHDRDPEDCEATGKGYPSKCPSARSPHAIRRGAITHHLNEEVSPEIASERMNVSLDVLYEHYDVRTAREKMEVRKNQLKDL